MGYILKNYVKPIMQCLTNDIKDYYMRLLTTKCLNSAVMIAYFMLGKKGIEIADKCDSDLTQKKHKAGEMNNTDVLEKLEKQITYKACKYRQLFYILMTDTTFSHDDGNSRHFPGHVFILEKIPNMKFYFHQSYINEYDYAGHIERSDGSLQLSMKSIERMMQQIRYILLNPTWDDNCVKYWKQIAHVDTSRLLGAHTKGKIFLCFQKAKVTDCINRLEKYTQKKLKEISKIPEIQHSEIYGNKEAYDSDQKPLTVIEMKNSLEHLNDTIQKSKKKNV